MKWAAILFAAFIVLIIILADAGRLQFLDGMNQIPIADKAGHFLLYGTLALLVNLALFRASPTQSRRRILWITGGTLAILIGLEEISQQFFAERSFDLLDLASSYLGVAFFSWLAIKSP